MIFVIFATIFVIFVFLMSILGTFLPKKAIFRPVDLQKTRFWGQKRPQKHENLLIQGRHFVKNDTFWSKNGPLFFDLF